jgi:excisionase family DNA binding protein
MGYEIMEERWLSVDEISVHLGVSRDTVYRWIEQSELPAHKVGRLWKFKVSEVDAWVKLGGTTHRGGKSNMVR